MSNDENTYASDGPVPARFRRATAHDVLKTIKQFSEEWKNTPRPNDLSDGYDYELMTSLIAEGAALDSEDSKLIDRVKNIIQRISLPEVSDPELDVSHLKLHWRVSKFQELLFELIFHASNGIAEVSDSAEHKVEEIRKLSAKIDKISEDLAEIRTTRKFGGVSVSVMGISAPVDTIFQAIQRARAAISPNEMDAKTVQRNLEDAYAESMSIWRKLRESAQQIAGATLKAVQDLITDVGNALRYALSMNLRERRAALSAMTLKLNGKLTIDELIDIRNAYRLVDKSSQSKSHIYSVVDKHISSFMYGIDIDEDTKYLKVAVIDRYEGGVFYLKNESAMDSSTMDLAMVRAERYFQTIDAFMRTVVSMLNERDLALIRLDNFAPVLTVEDAGPAIKIDEPLGI